MPQPQEDSGRIRVADVTLGQLSRGLYRSTATAFKELVSNAFDADASEVRIDTNYPEFDFVSCVDNGSGMSLDQFLDYFAREGIGSCKKRQSRETTPSGRPIIGRLGIGMMAIGQLCHSFEIQSHYVEDGQGRAYKATIVLQDTDIPDTEEAIRKGEEHIQVGTWHYDPNIDYDERKKGFRIYSSDVRKTFVRDMKGSVEDVQGKMSFKLAELRKQFYDRSSKSIRACGTYLEAIWELTTLCPLPYYGTTDQYPVDVEAFAKKHRTKPQFKRAIQFIRKRQEQLLDYNFRVVFDGVDLKRLTQLPTEGDTIPNLYFIDFDDKVFGRPLKFAGYLFAQIPKAVRPPELNGVQIRLRDVGIGGYDSTYLRYTEQIETIRSRWVSGEIFVDIGLESALNIDRDSFNEHDEHFKKLQSELHHKLRPVFDEIERVAASGRAESRDAKEKKLQEELRRIIDQRSGGALKLRQRKLGKNDPIVVVDDDRGEITVNTSARPLRKKKGRQVLGAAMVAYHAALRTAESEQERQEAFYQLLIEILDQLV